MKLICLDLSKRSAGLAGWDGKTSQPVVLSKQLGSTMTSPGMACARLHGVINDLNMVLGGADAIYCEEPLQPGAIQGHTTAETVTLAYGLFAHAWSYCEAKGIRFHPTNQTVWRRYFLGPMKRGTKRPTLKALAIERARQLGVNPANDDEAEAFGILAYACEMEGLQPPWSRDEILRPPLGVAQ